MNRIVTSCIVCEESQVTQIIRNNLPLFQCATCNLAWRTQFDVAETFYEEDNEVSLKKENLERRLRNVQDRIRLMQKYFSPQDLCDVGAGEGMLIRELARQGYGNVVGIEPNTRAVSFAQGEGTDVVSGTLEEVAGVIKERMIHAITLFHVIEHLDDPKGALANIYESLQAGDYMVIETPNARAYSFIRTKYNHPLIYPEHLYYFDIENLPQLLTKVGFTVVAKGKRGFDQYNMSIRQSLFCLGIGKPPFRSAQNNNQGSAGMSEHNETRTSLIRTFVRKVLSRLVIALGRVDYQWVIVRK